MNVSKATATKFLQSDEGAIAEVYSSYRNLLYFIIATYVREKEDCDDVYQELFLRILSKKDEIKDPQSLHYYLCSMAKNMAIDFAKKQAHVDTSEEMEETAEAGESQLDYFLPYDVTREEKAILGYRLTFGFSWKEVASMMGIPAPTARLRYAQAIKKIKGAYQK